MRCEGLRKTSEALSGTNHDPPRKRLIAIKLSKNMATTKKTKHAQIREAIDRFEQAIKDFDADGSGVKLLTALKDDLALASDPHSYGCSRDLWNTVRQVLQNYRTQVRSIGAWGGLLAELRSIVDA